MNRHESLSAPERRALVIRLACSCEHHLPQTAHLPLQTTILVPLINVVPSTLIHDAYPYVLPMYTELSLW